MICTNCGARLMETDQFCPKCGTKAIKDKRCPDCGALLRDGVKFCPKCGRLIGERDSAHGVSEDTLDIPIDAIERNILSETAAEIKADHRMESAPRKTSSAKSSSTRTSSERSAAPRSSTTKGSSEKSASAKSSSAHSSSERSTSHKSAASQGKSQSAPAKKKVANPEPPRKKKVLYREDDWEDDDWDDDDWDDDDDGVDAITIMTAVVGCVLLVVVAILGFHLYRQYVPKNYDKVAEQEQDQQEEELDQETEDDQDQDVRADDDRQTYTLTVIHNVNVRDNPSTSGSNVLMVAQEGETYTSYGSVDGGEWYEIILEDGSVGYVFYEYISIEE